MSKVVLGSSDGRSVSIDLDVLLRTRLLVQAGSGAGKSWALRRLAEQLFGKVQVILIDPEGEFATLRERYGYVLVGKGGETPADIRSAGLVATRLLELNASAVCDIYEMDPSARHEWVKRFLSAMIDAPKNLWHPVVVIVDEAHTFAPEKSAGESTASEAMIALATRGRKRGFCPIFATQRLGKLRKDAAAELQNVLVGRTFIDIDVKRAAEVLGILGGKGELREFSTEMRTLKDGQFYAFGRAISLERVLVAVGEIDTTHPEAGGTGGKSEPPPPPEKVKALLPKLADLPKQAEEKAKNEAELRSEIRSLKGQLAARPKIEVPKPEIRTVDVPILKDAQLSRLEADVARIEKAAEREATSAEQHQQNAQNLRAAAQEIRAAITAARTPLPLAPRVVTELRLAPARTTVRTAEPRQPGDGLTGPEQRVLDAIAWLESIGVSEPEQVAVAFLAGYTYGAGSFNNPKGSLRSKGFVEYLSGNTIRLTDAGRELARRPDAVLSTADLHAKILDRLPGPEQRVLKPLLEAFPESIDKEALAHAAGYTPGAGSFNNPCGRLRTLGLVEYPTPGVVRAREILFLEDAGR